MEGVEGAGTALPYRKPLVGKCRKNKGNRKSLDKHYSNGGCMETLMNAKTSG